MTNDALSTLARAFEAAAAVLRGTESSPTAPPVSNSNVSPGAELFTAAPVTKEEIATPAPAAPAKRGRGRPVKGEEAAPAPAQPAATPAPAAAASDPFGEDDDSLSAEPEAPAVSLEAVRAALAVVQAKDGQAKALDVFKAASGVETIAQLKPDKYGAVFAKAIPGGKLTLQDVKTVLVAANNRIANSGVGVMKDVGGVDQLPKLPEDKFVAVILAAHAKK